MGLISNKFLSVTNKIKRGASIMLERIIKALAKEGDELVSIDFGLLFAKNRDQCDGCDQKEE